MPSISGSNTPREYPPSETIIPSFLGSSWSISSIKYGFDKTSTETSRLLSSSDLIGENLVSRVAAEIAFEIISKKRHFSLGSMVPMHPLKLPSNR